MDFKEKLGNFAKNVKDKASDSLEINRINGDIFTEQRKIEVLEQNIGKIYWAKFLMGDEIDPEATELCDKIMACNDNIKKWETEIQAIREGNEKKEPSDEIEGVKMQQTCPNCGAPIHENGKYCIVCGHKLL